jgi:hypothetical protein
MTNEEIELAIMRGRLPFTFSDYFIVGTFLFGSLYLGVQYVIIDKPQFLFVAIGIMFSILTIASILYSKLLAAFIVSSPVDRKIRVLDQIISDFNGSAIKREDNCIRFKIGGGLFENTYKLTILYTEEGYYVNSIFPNNRGSQIYGSNKKKVKDILNRISQLESYRST